MITKDKVTEIFCIIDEFDKNLNAELDKNLRFPSHDVNGKRHRNRRGRLSESEIICISIPCKNYFPMQEINIVDYQIVRC